MSVRLGETKSVPRPVPGGSPQGSILGNYLFCATTDQLTKNINYNTPENHSLGEMSGDLTVADDDNPGTLGPVGDAREELSSEEEQTGPLYNDSALDESIKFFRVQQRFEFDSDGSAEDQTEEEPFTQDQINRELGLPLGWTPTDPNIFIYIDDANAVEKCLVPGSLATISQHKQETIVHAAKSEELFRSVTIRAAHIGMRVNQKKTQLLCVSASSSANISSYIRANDERIHSTNELKILGFIFGNKPSVKPHVEYMLNKARKRLWTLRQVKKAGLAKEDLLKVFNTVIRPALEYAAPTFHSMLPAYLSDEIEGVQRRACKIIFGYNSSYDDLINSGTIETLSSRREKLTVNFAKKCTSNPRFKHWFEEREENCLRNNVKYVETFAKTERLRKSPLHYMRRALNNE